MTTRDTQRQRQRSFTIVMIIMWSSIWSNHVANSFIRQSMDRMGISSGWLSSSYISRVTTVYVNSRSCWSDTRQFVSSLRKNQTHERSEVYQFAGIFCCELPSFPLSLGVWFSEYLVMPNANWGLACKPESWMQHSGCCLSTLCIRLTYFVCAGEILQRHQVIVTLPSFLWWSFLASKSRQ